MKQASTRSAHSRSAVVAARISGVILLVILGVFVYLSMSVSGVSPASLGISPPDKTPTQNNQREGKTTSSTGSIEPGMLDADVMGVTQRSMDSSDYVLEVSEDATPLIKMNGEVLLQCVFVFWGKDWKWADCRIAGSATQQGGYDVSGRVNDLGLSIRAKIINEPENVLRYDFEFNAERSLADIMGGGLEFRLALSSSQLPKPLRNPELLDDRGWRWFLTNDQCIEVTFSPSMAKCYFEAGNPSTIRCLLLGSQVEAGTHYFVMKVSGPSGARFSPSAAEQYARQDLEKWNKAVLDSKHFPIDVSFLNDPPAGKHGFLRVSGDEFVFDDGTMARFWGCNLAAYALFVDKKTIEEQARRIAQMGFNLVRLHHHDSISWVDPSVIDKSRDDTRCLDSRGMDCLDYWVKCLKDQGVYIWLDLHVGRILKAGDNAVSKDGIPGFDEIRRQGGRLNGFCYFNPAVQELMKEFNEQYLTHKNPYTDLAYVDDPAVAMMLVTNENDLTHHFGNLMLADKNNPVHRRMFLECLDSFCRKTGLSPAETGKTWLPGTSKIFLNEIEYRFHKMMQEHLYGLGVRVPIATTNSWGGMELFSLPSLASADFIDVHSYGQAEFLSTNPVHTPDYTSWIAAAQVSGKPLTVSEWNVPYPSRDRFIAPFYTAIVGAFQGWDALLIYGYSQDPFADTGRLTEWSTFTDPAIAGVMPAAALIYRRGDVRRAQKHYLLALDKDKLFFERTDPSNAAMLRTAPLKSGFSIVLPQVEELEWHKPSAIPENAEIVRDKNNSVIEGKDALVVSDTGDFRRDWRKGVITLDTPRSQGVAGWFGEKEISLSSTSFQIETKKAIVLVSSLDDAPIESSGNILITAMARAMTSGDELPFYSEPVRGTVRIHAPEGLTLYSLDKMGSRTRFVDSVYRDSIYTISLDGLKNSHWLMLEKEGQK